MERKIITVDSINIGSVEPPNMPGEEPTIHGVICFPMPDQAGLHRVRSFSGEELLVDMSNARINPSNKDPHVVIAGKPIGDRGVIVHLNNGIGREFFKPNGIVIFRARWLTDQLRDRKQLWKRNGW